MIEFFHFLAKMPLWLLHALGWLLGWLSFLLSPGYRRKFRENAAQAGYRWTSVRGAVGGAGRMVGELPRLWLGAPALAIGRTTHVSTAPTLPAAALSS